MTGTRVIGLVAENSPDFVAQAFACWGRGEAFVVLRSQDDTERLSAAGARDVLVPAAGHGWVDAHVAPRQDDAIAQVMFTSGTEGKAKGVVLSHENLADVVTRLTEVMQLGPEIREYVGVPVYHSFGFGRCRAVAAVGGKTF